MNIYVDCIYAQTNSCDEVSMDQTHTRYRNNNAHWCCRFSSCASLFLFNAQTYYIHMLVVLFSAAFRSGWIIFRFSPHILFPSPDLSSFHGRILRTNEFHWKTEKEREKQRSRTCTSIHQYIVWSFSFPNTSIRVPTYLRYMRATDKPLKINKLVFTYA